MAFEQALHQASPVVARHEMRPASPTIAQRPMPNAREASCPAPHALAASRRPVRGILITEWLWHGGGTYEHSGLPSSCSGSPLGVDDSEVSLLRSALDADKLPASW
jgi:hypothetical protein